MELACHSHQIGAARVGTEDGSRGSDGIDCLSLSIDKGGVSELRADVAYLEHALLLSNIRGIHNLAGDVRTFGNELWINARLQLTAVRHFLLSRQSRNQCE